MTELPEERLKQLREQAWDQAIHAFGTAYIFERRARGPKTRLFVLSFSGLVLPVILGSYVSAFGQEAPELRKMLLIVGVIAGLQAILAVWALAAKWDDQYTSAIDAARENQRLFSRFRAFGLNPPADAETVFQVLSAQRQAREEAEVSQLLTDKEKRLGMRAGLREIQRACVSCKKVPHSMKATDCPVCGDF